MMLSKYLSVPAATHSHFERNFIRRAVCELRFPTIFDFDESRPPIEFAKALRKDYPNYEARNEVNVGSGSLAKANVHTFSSKGNRWTVTLRPSAVSIETSKYTSFEDLRERIMKVVDAARKVIDSPFFTRIGLRYINVMQFPQEEISMWINPSLVAPLAEGLYGEPIEYSQRVFGHIEDRGNYLFQHGIGAKNDTDKIEYTLDYDFSLSDVDVEEATNTAVKLHEHQYNMFMWALGDNAKAYLQQTSGSNKGGSLHDPDPTS